jgi:hypothetical protein
LRVSDVALHPWVDVTIVPMSSARLLLLALILSTEISDAAAAQPSSIHVQLEVRSALNCASRAKVVDRVRVRSPKIAFVENNGEVVIGATFSKQAEVFTGEVTWLEGDKPAQVRRLNAGSCEDAVDGVALILAITLDPNAALELPEEVDSATSNGRAVVDDSPTPALKEPRISPSNASVVSVGDASALQAAESAAPGVNWRFSGAVAGELGLGIAPSPMLGTAALFEFSPSSPATLVPALVLGGFWRWSAASKQAEGRADFELAAITLDVCPTRFQWPNVKLHTCAAGLVGRLFATGSESRAASGRISRPFIGVGLAASLHWEISEHLGVLARVSPQVNVVRDEFEFGSRVFHEVPPLAIHVNVGLKALAP